MPPSVTYPEPRLWDSGGFPKVVLLDTTSLCNLRCSMCVHKDMTRPKGYMSWDLFKKIVDEVAVEDRHARVWMVFFGEALILQKREPSIFDMIAYAKSKGLTDVVLNSNGTLLHEKAARELLDSGLDAIYVGIDAFNEETYALLRVGGDYRETVENVKNLLFLKQKLGRSKPQVFVQFVEMDQNSAEKDAFIAYWTREGAAVKVRPKVSWGGLLAAPDASRGHARQPCYWAMRTLSVTDTGNVPLCAVDLDARCSMGNVASQSLRGVWNGKLKEIRRMHRERRFEDLPSFCQSCGDWAAARAEFFPASPKAL